MLWRPWRQQPAVIAPLSVLDDDVSVSADARMRDLATITHELRTPVTGMIGMAGLLLETSLTPEQATYAEAIRASGEALNALVDDILDLAAVDAGKIALEPGPFSPEVLAEQVVELLAPRAQEKGLEIASYVDPSVPQRLLGDVGRLRQILFNLAGNAVKYTRSGGVGLRVDVHAEGIVFAVHDTGPGLAPDALERLFRPFERGDRSAEGTGLGLSIAHRLARHLGGRVEVDSELGRGSSFAAVVPLHSIEAFVPEAEPPIADGLHVLVVVRSPFTGPWMAERLKVAGASPIVVRDMATARAHLSGAPGYVVPQLVIIDRGLQDDSLALSALAVSGGIRTIALVTPNERRDLAALRREGFGSYLVKPVRMRSLLNLVAGPASLESVKPDPEAGAESKQVDNAPAGRGRVLVAEDDAVNALLAQAQLSRMGFMVDHVADGAAAVSAFARALDSGRPYRLVLLDFRLPALDGCSAARHMRSVESSRRVSPATILAITANAGAAEKAEAIAAGMDGFLGKPLDRAMLASAMSRTAMGVDEATGLPRVAATG